jgi:hypothetical protein
LAGAYGHLYFLGLSVLILLFLVRSVKQIQEVLVRRCETHHPDASRCLR